MNEDIERVTPGTESWDRYGAEHQQRYEFFSSLYKDKQVVDAACGTGYGTLHIANSGARSAVGVDISEEAIRFAKKNYQRPNLNYTVHDCSRLSALPQKFDLAISFETIEHLQDPENFINEVNRSLQPGGIFICSTPNKARLSGAGNFNPFHSHELEWAEFKTIFEKYFDIQASYHQTETLEYQRIQELKHRLHQVQARSDSFLFNRMELFFRKLLGKNFRPVPFMNPTTDFLRTADLVMEPLAKPEIWHKTYILVGQVKARP